MFHKILFHYYLKKLGQKLSSNKFKLSIVESCSGGLLSSYLTRYSGASSFFDCAIVSYSNQAKEDLLNIPKEILNKYGAVSSETAELLAKNLQTLRHSDITIAITGIAGPNSDNSKKPVGLVYIAIMVKDILTVKTYNFSGKRYQIQYKACYCAIKLLLEHIRP